MKRAFKRCMFTIIIIVLLANCYHFMFNYRVQMRVDFNSGEAESRILRLGKEKHVIQRANVLPFARKRISWDSDWHVVRERPIYDVFERCKLTVGSVVYRSMIQLSYLASMMTFEEAQAYSEEFLRVLNEHGDISAMMLERQLSLSDEYLSLYLPPSEGRGLMRKRDSIRALQHAEGGEMHRVATDHGVPEQGQEWISPTTGMAFAWIAQMNMWVGVHEVTNAEYRIKETGHDSGDYAGRTLDDDRQPVVYIHFDDGNAYAAWMTMQDRASGWLPEGYHYRIPTGGEWMTFAQCGDRREYPWGNNWPPVSGQAGNYHGQEGAGSSARGMMVAGYKDSFPVAAPVDALWANPWGLKGVGGNVWEMTSKTPGGGFDAWRGASWGSFAQRTLSCESRIEFFDAMRFCYKGFRLVLESPESVNRVLEGDKE